MVRQRLSPPLRRTADLWEDGEDIRLRDIIAITGKSRPTIIAAIERGDLVGYQIVARRGSPWYFERRIVAEWWDRVKHPHPMAS